MKQKLKRYYPISLYSLVDFMCCVICEDNRVDQLAFRSIIEHRVQEWKSKGGCWHASGAAVPPGDVKDTVLGITDVERAEEHAEKEENAYTDKSASLRNVSVDHNCEIENIGATAPPIT